MAFSRASWEALWLVHTPPVTYARAGGGEGMRLIPGLAEELPEISEDGLTYRFRFRPGLRYGDGRPLRAGDFVRALERVLRLNRRARPLFAAIEGAPEYVAGSGRGIPGVEADDRSRRVMIRLTRPDTRLSYALATPLAAPVPPKVPVTESARPLPGVGPYRIAGARAGRIVLRRDRRFQVDGVPGGNVDEIAIGIQPDRERAARAVIDGELDYMQQRAPDDLLPELRSTYKDRYRESITPATHYLFLNPRRAPFRSERARQAASFAIDGDKLRRLSLGRLEPSCNVLAPNVPGYERLDPCPYGGRSSAPNLERARALVEGSRARRRRVTLVGSDRGLTRYFAGTLRKIGFRARPRVVSEREAERLAGTGRTRAQAAVVERAPLVPHPASYLATADLRGLPASIVDDAATLALASKLGATEDDWASLDRRLVEGAWFAPFGVGKASSFVSERIDADNCLRYHPVYGTDYSSFCLR